MLTPDRRRMNVTLFTAAMLAGALAIAPSAAEAAPASPGPDPTGRASAPAPLPAPAESAGVGGPIEPVELDASAILVEGRTTDDGRWTGAVDPALARRYAPREPVRYNQITIPF